MLRKNILLAGLLCIASPSFAQHCYLDYPIVEEKCATSQLREWRQQNILNTESNQEFEEWLSHKINETKFSEREEGIITIPTVVHVIHNGEAIGNYPNISDAQIISQINVLNQDFRRLVGTNGFNEHPDGADMEVEFCLVVRDPNLNPTNGIDRQSLAENNWDFDLIESAMKPSTIWDPEQYFNIWLCNLADEGLLGYAQFPIGSGLEGQEGVLTGNTDGIVVEAECFGTIEEDDGSFILDDINNLGRTATHEMGHFLGLLHPWGAGGCQSTDYCDDTPLAAAEYSDCPIGEVSCGSEDMIENYMGYTNDSCKNVFTNDQKNRMQTVLANSPRRASLGNSTLCTLPPSFSYSGQVINAYTQEIIPNALVAFKGAFVLETTTNSQGLFQIPMFLEGEYEVLSGGWGYLTKLIPNQYFDGNTGNLIIELEPGYYDDFAFDFGWEVTNDADSGEWLRDIPLGSVYEEMQFDPATDLDGDYGNYCFLTGNGGDLAPNSDVDNGTTILTSPVFDASLYENPKLSFYRWFVTATIGDIIPDDQLEISISNGVAITVLKTIDVSDDSMRTWVYEEFLISDYILPTENMRLILSISDQVTTTHGHLVDAAIDLFKVEGYTVGVDNLLEEEIDFSLFPNPTDGMIGIQIEELNPNTEIHIFNAIGQEVYAQNIMSSSIEINLGNQTRGVYFLQFNVEGKTYIKRLVIR